MCYNGFTIKINLFKSGDSKMEGVPTKILGRATLILPGFYFHWRGLGGLLRENRRSVNRLGISRTGLWSQGSLWFLQNDPFLVFSDERLSYVLAIKSAWSAAVIWIIIMALDLWNLLTSLLLLKIRKNDLADKEVWALIVTDTLKKF